MKIHFYTSRRRGGYWNDNKPPRYKVLCTKEWMSALEETRFDEMSTLPMHLQFTTSHERVNCQECLNILIPKLESKLLNMKKNRLEAVVEPMSASAST